MSKPSNETVLAGCAPTPLASYLKALGILRAVAEQADASAAGFWRGETFVLRSALDEAAILRFFETDWRPTPLVSPWNAGGGFYFQEGKSKEIDPLTGKKVKTGIRDAPTEATRRLGAVASSSAPRLSEYAELVRSCKALFSQNGIEEVPVDKGDFVNELRGLLPDNAIRWLDASVQVIATREHFGLAFPPLLGTGGNDGNLDFSHTFRSRLASVINFTDGNLCAGAAELLRLALFDVSCGGLESGSSPGQFLPSGTGGVNGESGFDSDALTNPWDFILMMEGVLLFASAAVKKLETRKMGELSFPFSVRQTNVGYASAAVGEPDSRNEIWLPLWQQPAGLPELAWLLGEGRSQVGNRGSKTATDFARAVASVGVDRGVASFQRFGFLVRNGLAYFATPLGRFAVSRQPQVDLLSDIDDWLDRFLSKASVSGAPASIVSAARRLELAILTLCQRADTRRVQDVLIALGECEASLAKSKRWANDNFLRPVAPLSAAWLAQADDGSRAFRLAASLAGSYAQPFGPLRSSLEAVDMGVKDGHLWVGSFQSNDADVVWHDGPLAASLGDILKRRITKVQSSGAQTYPDVSKRYATLADVTGFIESRVEDDRLAKLLWGLILLDWPAVAPVPATTASDIEPSAGYALLRLCFTQAPISDKPIPVVPAIAHAALAGQFAAAARAAVARLRGSGLPPAVTCLDVSPARSARIGAALLFPIGDAGVRQLAGKILRITR
jgi:CRISPR-associated protein Csx17